MFGGLSAVVGHELLHNKSTFNKCMGTWGFTKFMYSHFFDEHLRGHHKTLGTPMDPATAVKNESIYSFMIKSWVGSHINVWNMETKRIKRKLGDNVPLALNIFNNKMTQYFCLHVSILSTIYLVFGWSSLKY